MSYLVLARKYRPKTFSEVVGQEVLTRTLAGAIEAGRIGHAYLFCGSRGTGKTTTARIFAKALNCERGPRPDPCGECERCLAADAGTDVDIVEIDAASHTGVDHVRELREQANYAPLRARFKIYVVDEVHMLSRAAFNALLKTLEEPPPHVKFLFATTEPNKLPDTIISRCQVLRLSPLPEALIKKRLDEVLAAEGVRPERGLSAEIARRARGGMRDALSMTDQLLALVGDEPRIEDLVRLGGPGGREELDALLERVFAGDGAGLLAALPEFEGGEGELIDSLLSHVRDSLVLAVAGPDAPHVEASPETRRRMAERGREVGVERLELVLEELIVARERLRTLPQHGRTILESALLSLARPGARVPLAELVDRLAALEARLAAGGASAAGGGRMPGDTLEPNTASASSGHAGGSAGRAGSPTTEATNRPPEPSRSGRGLRRGRARPAPGTVEETWQRFLEALAERAGALGEVYLRRARLVELGGGRGVVRLSRLTEQERALALDVRNRKLAARTLSDVVGGPVELSIEDASGVRPGDRDPFTRKVADLFGGRIED